MVPVHHATKQQRSLHRSLLHTPPLVVLATPEPIEEPFTYGLDGAGDAGRRRRKAQSYAMNGPAAKRRGASPFDGASSDDGRRRKNNGNNDRNKNGNPFKSASAHGKDFKSKKSLSAASGSGSGSGSGSRQRSAAAMGYEVDENAYPTNPTSQLAKNIYDRLRNDQIFPPKWPTNRSPAAMSKLRENFTSYRELVRESLIEADLIDKPGVQKRLEDALVFKGICEDRCPEFEKICRITENDVLSPEKDHSVDPPAPLPNKMVKKHARSAAGQDAPLPMDVLSVGSLRRTLDYLIDDLLQSEERLPSLHHFLWDRTRAVRRDFTFHSTTSPEELKDQVYCFETIARFHVTSLHLLSRPGAMPEKFEEQQEIEQLSKTLISLMSLYDSCKGNKVVCNNEPEFRAYYALFFASRPDIHDSFQRADDGLRTWKDHDIVRTAVALIEALQSTGNVHGPLAPAPDTLVAGCHTTYFKIVESSDTSYTMACFAEIHFNSLRRRILQTLKMALRRPKMLAKDVTPSYINTFLRFDSDDEVVDFIEKHGLNFVDNDEFPNDKTKSYLNVKDAMEFPRLGHSFSRSLVERKRGSRSLINVIHETTYEHGSGTRVDEDEEELFVPGISAQEHARQMNAGTPSLGNFMAKNLPAKDRVAGTNPFSKTGPQTQPTSMPFGSTSTTTAANSSPFQSSFPPASSSTSAPPSQKPSAFASPFAPSSGVEGQSPGSSGFKSPFSSGPSADSQLSKGPSGFGSRFGQASTSSEQPKASLADFKGKSPFSGGSSQQPPSTSAFSSVSSATPSFGQPDALSGQAQNPAEASGKGKEKEQNFVLPGAGASQTSAANSNPFAAFGDESVPPKPPNPFEKLRGVKDLDATLASAAEGLKQSAAAPISGFSGVAKPTGQEQEDASSTAATGIRGTASSAFPTGESSPPSSSTPFPTTNSQPTSTPSNVSSVPSTLAPSAPAQLLPTAQLPRPSTGLGSAASSAPTTTRPQPSSAAALPSSTLGSLRPPDQPRDRLGDFTNWFVKGDAGLLEEFQKYITEQIVRKTYNQYWKDEAERKRKEEEERDAAAARKFQVYNLSLKFFYRWRETARKRRLRRRRLQDKEDYRAYMAAKRAEEIAQRKREREIAEARQAALERNHGVDPVEEFRDLLHMPKERTEEEYEEALYASGVLSGIANERDAIARIVRNDMPPPAPRQASTPKRPLPNGTASGHSQSARPRKSGGAKTQALRDHFFGNGSTTNFRRSLPSSASASVSASTPSWRASTSPSAGDQPKRVSKVSDRWRLKAMGLVTMPDGTALPEKLANSMRYDGQRYDGWGSFGLDHTSGNSNRHSRSRSTSAELNHSAAVRSAFSRSFRSSSATTGVAAVDHVIDGVADEGAGESPSPQNMKRKRDAGDEGASVEDAGTGPGKRRAASGEDRIERILREARELRGSLQSSRADLDETTGWFKEQSGMMEAEMSQRGSSSAWEQ